MLKQHYHSLFLLRTYLALAFLPSRASVALTKSAKALSTSCASCLRRPRVTRYGRSLWCKAASSHQLMSTPPSLVILPVVTAAHVPAAVATTGWRALFGPSPRPSRRTAAGEDTSHLNTPLPCETDVLPLGHGVRKSSHVLQS